MSKNIKLEFSKKQKYAWDILHDPKFLNVYYGGAAGGGKSMLLCMWLIKQCLMYPGFKGFIGRTELKRLMLSTYQTFIKVARDNYGLVADTDWWLDGKLNIIHFKNGSTIDLLDLAYAPSDPDYQRFGSMEYTQGAIDEAGEVDYNAYLVIGTRVGRQKNTEFGLHPVLLCTGNPSKNWTYTNFYQPHKNNKEVEGNIFIQALVTDSKGFIDEQYIKKLENLPEGPMKERLFHGNWDYADDELSLFKGEVVKDMFTVVLPAVNEFRDMYMTIDVARFGDDATVYTIWRGLKCIKIIEKRKQSLIQTADYAEILSLQYNIPRQNVIVDEDGVGSGVVDIFRGCRGFHGGGRPIDRPAIEGGFSMIKKENFKNLRSQCYFKLSTMAEDRHIRIDTDDNEMKQRIFTELGSIKSLSQYSDKNPLQVIPKDLIKKAIGKSPDIADALMMRMIFEISPVSSFTPAKVYKPKVSSN